MSIVATSPDPRPPGGEFQTLRECFQEVIEELDSTFTSHQFILELARRFQSEYARALNLCVDDKNDPFRKLHRSIAGTLNEFPHLIERLPDVESEDIFRRRRICAAWRKRDRDQD